VPFLVATPRRTPELFVLERFQFALAPQLVVELLALTLLMVIPESPLAPEVNRALTLRPTYLFVSATHLQAALVNPLLLLLVPMVVTPTLSPEASRALTLRPTYLFVSATRLQAALVKRLLLLLVPMVVTPTLSPEASRALTLRPTYLFVSATHLQAALVKPLPLLLVPMVVTPTLVPAFVLPAKVPLAVVAAMADFLASVLNWEVYLVEVMEVIIMVVSISVAVDSVVGSVDSGS